MEQIYNRLPAVQPVKLRRMNSRGPEGDAVFPRDADHAKRGMITQMLTHSNSYNGMQRNSHTRLNKVLDIRKSAVGCKASYC